MTFVKDATAHPGTWISIFTLSLPVTESHVQDTLAMVSPSLVILFNHHSLKVLTIPPGVKMNGYHYLDGYHYLHGCAVVQQEEMKAGCSNPTAETASWGGHVWFRPHTSVLLQKPQLDLRSTRSSQRPTHDPTQRSHREVSDTLVQSFKASCAACGTGAPLVFPACSHLLSHTCGLPTEQNHGEWVLPCAAIPRLWAGWPRGGTALPCHSAAHYCFSMSQCTD